MPKRVFLSKSVIPSSWLNLIENHTHSDPALEGAGGQLEIKSSDITPLAITEASIDNGAVTLNKISDGAVAPAKLSIGHPTWDTGGILSATAFSGPLTGKVTGNASTATALSTASGSAPSYAARAWVNWEGSTGTIRGAGNVSSVTHTATGLHTVNMTVAMPNTYYAVVVSCTQQGASSSCNTTGTADDTTARTASSFATRAQQSTGTDMDVTHMQAVVFE